MCSVAVFTVLVECAIIVYFISREKEKLFNIRSNLTAKATIPDKGGK